MKTLIVGLDGVPRSLLEQLSSSGVMPECGKLIAQGALHDLKASIPEISSVNWTSFMTGASPGAHGVFGFTDLVPGTLKIRFPRFADVATDTFWDRLGKKGHRSVVINQPSTYPARAIPGALVAGFVALDLDRAVFPAKHLPRLEGMKYAVDVDNRKAHADKVGLLDELEATLKAREEAADYFWTGERWDLFQVVVTGTDRLQHFLWDALEEEDHPLHARVIDYYRAVDGMVGRVVTRFKNEHSDGAFFALSDHGFCRCRYEVRLNAWLRDNGYLDYKVEERTSLEDLADSTRVFCMDPGRLYFRDKSEVLKDEIIDKLSGLEHEGEPVIRAVHRREDIYEGPLTEQGPELIVQTLDGFDLKGNIRSNDAFAAPVMTGMHNPDAFLLADSHQGEDLEIADLAGIIERLYE